MQEIEQTNLVADTLAIQTVKARYCEAADLLPVDAEAARAGLEAVFAAGATADYGAGILTGREAILEFLIDALSTTRVWLWHAIHTPIVEVSGNSAAGRWTIVAMMKETAVSPIETAYGRYVNTFTREPGGWRIATMRWVEEARG